MLCREWRDDSSTEKRASTEPLFAWSKNCSFHLAWVRADTARISERSSGGLRRSCFGSRAWHCGRNRLAGRGTCLGSQRLRIPNRSWNITSTRRVGRDILTNNFNLLVIWILIIIRVGVIGISKISTSFGGQPGLPTRGAQTCVGLL